jgi:hypothetical protein
MGLNEAEYFTYHMIMFYVQIVSIEDLCLAAVNEACEIGIADKDLKYGLLSSIPILYRTKIIGALYKMDRFMDKYRPFRNVSVHQAYHYPNRDFGEAVWVKSSLDHMKAGGILPNDFRKDIHLFNYRAANAMQKELTYCANALVDCMNLVTDLMNPLVDWILVVKEHKSLSPPIYSVGESPSDSRPPARSQNSKKRPSTKA